MSASFSNPLVGQVDSSWEETPADFMPGFHQKQMRHLIRLRQRVISSSKLSKASHCETFRACLGQLFFGSRFLPPRRPHWWGITLIFIRSIFSSKSLQHSYQVRLIACKEKWRVCSKLRLLHVDGRHVRGLFFQKKNEASAAWQATNFSRTVVYSHDYSFMDALWLRKTLGLKTATGISVRAVSLQQ